LTAAGAHQYLTSLLSMSISIRNF